MTAYVFAIALVGVTNALRCYQGQQNASLPVQNSPMDCLANSMSCLLTLDMATNTATRSCQISNCTLNGEWSARSVCTNTSSNTGSMYGSLTTYCCCYGDGCNEDQETMLNPEPVVDEFSDGRDRTPTSRRVQRSDRKRECTRISRRLVADGPHSARPINLATPLDSGDQNEKTGGGEISSRK